MFQKFKLILIQ